MSTFNRPHQTMRGFCLFDSDPMMDTMTGPLSRIYASEKNLAAGEKEKSGGHWVERFPTSRSVDDLEEGFRANVERFLEALDDAKAVVEISATYRPPERAYLMHYSYKIANGWLRPAKVPPMAGVEIDWVHDTYKQSRAAAVAMVNRYKTVHQPSLKSRHMERAAIDMTIWKIVGKTITNGKGRKVKISALSDLYPVGRSFGVIKLVTDAPHWSDNGG